MKQTTDSNCEIENILTYWFGNLEKQPKIDSQGDQYKRWFIKNKKTDEEIRGRFEAMIIKGKENELKGWEKTPRGKLALIILYDQFSRNIYRGSAKSFENDFLALDLCLQIIEQREDKAYRPIEAVFLYLPLEHSEDLAMQERSVQCFQELYERAQAKNDPNLKFLKGTVNYAIRHYDVINQFSRFPHRNALLGRISTLEETEFLKQPGSSF